MTGSGPRASTSMSPRTARSGSAPWSGSIPTGKAGSRSTVHSPCREAADRTNPASGTSLDRWKVFKLSMRRASRRQTDDGKPTGGPGQLNYRVFPDSPVRSFDTFVLDGVLTNAWNHSGQHSTGRIFRISTSPIFTTRWVATPRTGAMFMSISTGCTGACTICTSVPMTHGRRDVRRRKEEYDASNTARAGPSSITASAATPRPTSTPWCCRQPGGGRSGRTGEVRGALPDAGYRQLHHGSPRPLVCDELGLAGEELVCDPSLPRRAWRFHAWDAEHGDGVLECAERSRPERYGIHDKLKGNAEYRMHFADLVHRFFFNGGVLHVSPHRQYVPARMTQIDRAIVGESARWGDTRSGAPHTCGDWLVIQDKVLSTFIRAVARISF